MKTITYQQYLQLLGLLTLAERHNRALTDIKLATAEVVSAADPDGHVGDAVYGDADADALLDRLGITVEPRSTEVA